MTQDSTILRPISLAIAAAIAVAAVLAIVTVLSGDAGEREFQIFFVGVALALYSLTASVGMWGWWKEPRPVQALGLLTLVLATVTFVFAVVTTFAEPSLTVSQIGATCGLATLALVHLTLTSGAMRASDPPAQRVLDGLSMLMALFTAGIGVLLVAGAIDDFSEGLFQLVGVSLIGLVATTDIAALLRRGRRG